MPPPAEPPGEAARRKAAAKPCPICGKPAEEATRPFCSPRCRDVDLNRWLSGTHVAPSSENDEENGQ